MNVRCSSYLLACGLAGVCWLAGAGIAAADEQQESFRRQSDSSSQLTAKQILELRQELARSQKILGLASEALVRMQAELSLSRQTLSEQGLELSSTRKALEQARAEEAALHRKLMEEIAARKARQGRSSFRNASGEEQQADVQELRKALREAREAFIQTRNELQIAQRLLVENAATSKDLRKALRQAREELQAKQQDLHQANEQLGRKDRELRTSLRALEQVQADLRATQRSLARLTQSGAWQSAYYSAESSDPLFPHERLRFTTEDQSDFSGPGSLHGRALLVVDLPASDAVVFINGNRFAPRGDQTRREFLTPMLDPDRAYGYEVRVELLRDGRLLSSSKQVTFARDMEKHVGFTDMNR